jgi:hypothetical protein
MRDTRPPFTQKRGATGFSGGVSCNVAPLFLIQHVGGARKLLPHAVRQDSILQGH